MENARDLSGAAAQLPGDSALIIEYLNARGPDGKARKYRVMIIDDKIYPLHLAVSRHGKCTISRPTWRIILSIGGRTPRFSMTCQPRWDRP